MAPPIPPAKDAPPDSANTANLAEFAESGGAALGPLPTRRPDAKALRAGQLPPACVHITYFLTDCPSSKIPCPRRQSEGTVLLSFVSEILRRTILVRAAAITASQS